MNLKEINPFGHAPESEFPSAIVPAPNWTEHYFFQGFDFEQEMGVCIHMGRLVADPEIWRPTIQIYMPGQDLLVTTLHQRGGHPFGGGAVPLKVSCIEPFRLWSVEFDGVAQRVPRQQLMNSIVREAPVEPIRFHLLFEAAGPYYGRKKDMDDGRGVHSFHTEQVMTMRGHFQHRGKVIFVRGVGARDHSNGPRDYGTVIGDLWFQGMFENGDCVHMAVVRLYDTQIRSGYFYDAATKKIDLVEAVEHPFVEVADTPPASVARDPLSDPAVRNYEIVLRRPSGELMSIYGELVHSHAITYMSPMEEMNGTNDDGQDGLQMCEAPTMLRWKGMRGWGLRERTHRIRTLRPPVR